MKTVVFSNTWRPIRFESDFPHALRYHSYFAVLSMHVYVLGGIFTRICAHVFVVDADTQMSKNRKETKKKATEHQDAHIERVTENVAGLT